MFNWSKLYGKNKKSKEETIKNTYESPETAKTSDTTRSLESTSPPKFTSTSDSGLAMSTPITILPRGSNPVTGRCCKIYSSSVNSSEISPNNITPSEKRKLERRRSVKKLFHYSRPSDSLTPSSEDESPLDLQGKQFYVAIYDYEARTKEDLSFSKNNHLEIIQNEDSDWWLACDDAGTVGYIPSNFVAKVKSVEAEPWYFGYITRSEADRLLLQSPNSHGAFLIRVSETRQHEYSLSVRDGDIVKHYRIHCTEEESLYISPQNVFSSLKKLVEYYSSQTSGMCCRFLKPCIKLEKPDTCGLSYNTVDTWEIQREQIELKEKLGTGNFGEVYKGVWNKTTEIAVKTLKKGSATQKEFLAEAQVMKKLRHPKLIQLYGVCTNSEPFYIIAEFMKFGSLDKYLRVYGHGSNLVEKLSIGAQVASGMAYLESHNFIHRDLAARNVLVGEGLTCKVADFGLSRILQEDEYLALEGTRFPIKWTAPEALCYNRFSVKSDVWSFGIFLMEVFTNGAVPYPELSNQEVIERTTEGHRMQRPRNCPREIYTLMLECWDKEPQLRPSFDTLWQTMESFCAILLNK